MKLYPLTYDNLKYNMPPLLESSFSLLNRFISVFFSSRFLSKANSNHSKT